MSKKAKIVRRQARTLWHIALCGLVLPPMKGACSRPPPIFERTFSHQVECRAWRAWILLNASRIMAAGTTDGLLAAIHGIWSPVFGAALAAAAAVGSFRSDDA